MSVYRKSEAAEEVFSLEREFDGKRKPPASASKGMGTVHVVVSGFEKGFVMPVIKEHPQIELRHIPLVKTVDLLCTNASEIISRFKNVFEARKKVPGTVEFGGGKTALAEALNLLLTRSLPCAYHDALRRYQNAPSKCKDPSFRKDMRTALELVESEHPETMRWFNETQEASQLNAVEAMAGLFLLYSDNAHVYSD